MIDIDFPILISIATDIAIQLDQLFAVFSFIKFNEVFVLLIFVIHIIIDQNSACVLNRL